MINNKRKKYNTADVTQHLLYIRFLGNTYTQLMLVEVVWSGKHNPERN